MLHLQLEIVLWLTAPTPKGFGVTLVTSLSNFSGFRHGASIRTVVVKAGRIEGGQAMSGVLSAVTVAVGSARTFGAKLYPLRTDTLETCAGALLILGFGLLGWVLPHMS